VALGNSAALGTLGVEGILSLRVGPGRTSPYGDLEGVRIIPTVHPAACLRQSDMFPSLVADIGKVVTPHVPWVDPEWTVYDDPVDAIAYLGRVEQRAADCVVDIEVDIEKDIAFDHPDRYGLLCVGLFDEAEGAVVIGEGACADDGVRDALGRALRASRLIAHNGKFDLAGLYSVVGPLQLFFDTMLASYSLDERPRIHGLKDILIELLGAPRYDQEIEKYNPKTLGYGVIPRPILYKYNAYDVYGTWLLYQIYKKRLETKEPTWWADFAHYPFCNLRYMHDFLVNFGSNALMYLELNGIQFDRVYNRELMTTFQETLAPLEEDIDNILIGAGWHAINPRSPKQVKEALQFFGVKTDSTAEDILRRLLDILVARNGEAATVVPLYQFCEVLLQHRRQQKLYSTYVKGLGRRVYRGRLYSSFLLHGSTTGRLASRNPNLQNIPRDAASRPGEPSIKRQFIPARAENVFIQGDYAQAELRVLTWLARDEYFRTLLNSPDRDFFDELTPMLYPHMGTKDTCPPELWKELRIRVKAFVYGLGYGRDAFSIAMEFKISQEEAEAVKRRFFEVIPQIVEWQKMVRAHVKSGKDLITPFGRHRRFHLITKENWKDIQNEALAFLPQSTSSDVCLRAMARLRTDLRGSGCFIRNIVHDSILVDGPAEYSELVARLLDYRMLESAQELVGDYVQFKVDVKIGKHWGEV
jgi:DNA polymerase-1